MSEKHSSGLDKELLDDFFAEADEHLLNIRHALMALEATGNDVAANSKIIGDLFHNFHSFKGISSIVGLAPAEALAHATEDLLRLMRNGQVRPGKQVLNAMSGVSHKLEQIVAAFREEKPSPAHETLLAEIKRQFPAQAASEAGNPKSSGHNTELLVQEAEEAKRQGLQVWKYTFAPTQELNAQKVNINSIREELAREGDILKSTPVVKGKGLITFEFLIAREQTPTDIKEWAAKGVTVELANDAAAGVEAASPAHPPTAEEGTHSPFLAPSHIVRVDLKRLDDLLRIVGEMVIHRSRLDLELARVAQQGERIDFRGVNEVNRMLGRSLRQMREDIMRIRLIPIAEIFGRLPFVIRDLSRQTSKKVQLKMTGEETAIDKYLIEKLKDPLLHMVRNAFSHGIETTEERKAAGKPEEATIELSAVAIGDQVIIKSRDDGKGIDAKAILERAKKLGIKMPETVDNEAILNILCSAGFSTRDKADLMSGRGVGMSVVQTTIKELGGKLTLESEAGKGTQFTMRLPLTVVIAETFLVSAAGQTCAVPQSSVREIFHAAETDVRMADGIEIVPYRGGVLPITRLAGLFNLKSTYQGLGCVLVVTSERGSIGLLVEKVLGQKEVVVRTFRDPLLQVAGVSGATELGDGKPVLILDGSALTAGKVRPLDILTLAHT